MIFWSNFTIQASNTDLNQRFPTRGTRNNIGNRKKRSYRVLIWVIRLIWVVWLLQNENRNHRGEKKLQIDDIDNRNLILELIQITSDFQKQTIWFCVFSMEIKNKIQLKTSEETSIRRCFES